MKEQYFTEKMAKAIYLFPEEYNSLNATVFIFKNNPNIQSLYVYNKQLRKQIKVIPKGITLQKIKFKNK